MDDATATSESVDPADAPASEGVMIALLPITTDWCQIELAHMTLVYAGTIDDHQPGDFNELAKDAASLAMMCTPLYLMVRGVEILGDTEKVNALMLRPSSELLAMRRAVESWNASQFPFNPHCTIGPATGIITDYPRSLAFDRVYVGWGDESLTFLMKGNSRPSAY